MQTQTRIPASPRRHRLDLLAAVIFAIVLVGSLVTVLQLAHQQHAAHTGARSSSNEQTVLKPGQVIYSATLTSQDIGSPIWSADGQRIAVSGSPTLIWDATTGQHRVTIPLNPSPIASPAWSPASDLLAIPTTGNIIIVNGQSGKIITSYPMPSAASASTGAPSTGGYLSAFLPRGGAPTFGGVAWSPDGKLIASTFSSSTADGVLQVWNPQTGQPAFTLAKKAGYGYGDIAWSSDGKYIAAITWNWDGGGASQINVWSVQTHQIVFQQTANQGFDGVSWQPRTDNLASALVIPGSNSNLPGPPVYNSAVLKIWNVTTGQLLKSFPGVEGPVWSPDGQEIAYILIVSPTSSSSVTILDVKSGQKVYTYHVTSSKGQSADLSTLAWSPDGKYMVTIAIEQASATPGTQLQQSSAVVQVWVA